MSTREVQLGNLTRAYDNLSGDLVAFVDESYITASSAAPSIVAPFYLMTAYVVPRRLFDMMRGEIVEVVESQYWHSTEAHMTEEGRRRIEAFATYVAEGNEAIIVALKSPLSSEDRDGEGARADCMRELLRVLASGLHCAAVSLVIFEERRQSRQRNRDGSIVRSARQDGLIPRSMHVMPASPTDERLLWFADLVSFALYQRYARTRFDYAAPFIERVVEVRVK